MQNRAKRIFSYVGEEVDAVIFMNDEEPNVDAMFPYITGTTGGLFESCLAVAWPDGKVELLTNVLEETSARFSWSDVWVFQNRADKEKHIKRMLGKVKRIGVNAHGLSYSNLLDLKSILPKAGFFDVGKGLLAARLVKDKEEIERLRKACQIVSRVADEIPSFIKPGQTEYEAAAEINYRMQRYGASAPSFGTNASFGDNSAEPHHEPDERKCRKNDVALFDFGALYRKYGSDLTRTFFVGKATKQQKRMYQVVLEAQLAALAVIKPGVNGKDVDAVARQIIDGSEFKGLFIHSLGHSIGLSVHDGARLAPNVDIVLEEGMVLTVEPGVYLSGNGGVRIEDDILVTKKGCEVLTTAAKELRVI